MEPISNPHNVPATDTGADRARGQCSRRAARAGLSLVEVSISTLLVGLVLISSLKAVGGVIHTRVVADQVHDGTALARDLMNEILAQHYVEPTQTPAFGREGGEPPSYRSAWDDVDDYNGWSASPPQDRPGWALPGYTGWTRGVTVDYAKLSNPTANALSDEGLKRITVTVTAPTGRQTQLTAWRSLWGALEQSPAADTTVQTRIDSQIQVGSGTTLYSGTALQNHARDL